MPVRGDRDGRAGFRVFLATLDLLLEHHVTCIAEQAFDFRLATADLVRLSARAKLVLLHCTVPQELSIARYRECAAARSRAAHPDAEILQQMDAGTFDWAAFEPLDLATPTLRIDTSAGYSPALDDIETFLRQSPRAPSGPLPSRRQP